ncbi:unnamed protein product [Dibothriocephalus latus]|uniref:DM10 domain-containing protein n=1 Tax=Dibothriocephalus latus TaxID=60516 RepID=A0A3P7M7N0_DIBLA|nr:unnamed protein product [Dibothriocephalus latus]
MILPFFILTINSIKGTLVKRHRIAKPPPNDHLFYTVHDFNVGMDLELYGRKIRLVACDKFTENFLRKLGVRVNEPEPVPEDPYTSLRLGISEAMQPKRPYSPVDKLRKFLDHDRHVLRFNCFWDDTESLYGDAREMILHYFLGESTKFDQHRIHSDRTLIPSLGGGDFEAPCLTCMITYLFRNSKYVLLCCFGVSCFTYRF